MAVLKHTSPTACPLAPKPKPSSTVPSASTSTAVASGSAQAEAAGCESLMRSLNLLPNPPNGRFARGHSRVAREDQRGDESGAQSAGQAQALHAAPRQCGDQERRYRTG